jgi:hypothetical protein
MNMKFPVEICNPKTGTIWQFLLLEPPSENAVWVRIRDTDTEWTTPYMVNEAEAKAFYDALKRSGWEESEKGLGEGE